MFLLNQRLDSTSLALYMMVLDCQHDRGVMIYISNLLVYKRRTDLEDPRPEASELTSHSNPKAF